MPNLNQLNHLIELVKQNKAIEAYKKFYHDDVVVQEANFPPRIGLAASIDHVSQGKDSTKEIHEVSTPKILVDGDHSIIEWHAEWTITNGTRIRVEEVALQTWRDDKICHERFFYDPTPLIEAGLLPPIKSLETAN